MKLSNNQIAVAASAGLCSLVVSVLVTSGNVSLKLLSLAGLLAVPPSAIAFIALDNRAQQKINTAQRKLSDAIANGNQTKSRLTVEENKSARLQAELTTLQSSFERAKVLLKECEAERCQSALSINQLNQSVSELQSSLVIAQSRVEELEVECEEWEREFHVRINLEADKRFQAAKHAEIRKIEGENDEITREAIEIARSFRQWAMQVDERLQDRGEYIKGVTNSYNTHLEGLKGSVARQVDEYLKQIEILNNKVAMLQQKLAGDLIEPQYGQFGYAVEGKIANDLAQRIWGDLQIPLVVKGYQVKSDGSVDVGYGYSRSIQVERLVSDLQRHSGDLAKWLGIHKITAIRKLEIADLLVLTFRREPIVKESEVLQLVGTAQEFTRYVTSNQIRYRLIADPHSGKTPTTAVMLSAILKAGTRQANTEKGAKVRHTLVSVAYPGRESSLKDERYPLDLFLKYATEASTVKSFSDAVEDWKFRKTHTSYAKQFFQIWCWDEFDNTIASASDPKGVAEDIKQLLKQAHHTNQGWIFSGQSVMTSQIPGFTNDDRSLFIEIVIGTPKIRKYLETYGKQRNSDETLNKLRKNLDAIQDYVEHQNEKITDEARQLRVALVMDSRSPKLFFLPNLDDVDFEVDVITEIERLAAQMKSGQSVHTSPVSSGKMDNKIQDSAQVSISAVPDGRPKLTIPHCPECGSSNVTQLKDTRYRCKDCGVKRAASKVIWK
jgi:hypothetical protein